MLTEAQRKILFAAGIVVARDLRRDDPKHAELAEALRALLNEKVTIPNDLDCKNFDVC